MTDVAVAVVKRHDQFLVGQRPQGVALSGFWEFPGGKIEAGESARQAAVRECREETGLNVTVAGTYGQAVHQYQAPDSAVGEPFEVRLQFLACEPVEPVGDPRSPFRWIPVQQLAQLDFPPANAEVIRQLVAGDAPYSL